MKPPRADAKLKRLPPEEQAALAARLAEPGAKLAAVARELGVAAQTLSEWRAWYAVVRPVQEASAVLARVREVADLDRPAMVRLLDATLLLQAQSGDVKAAAALRRALSADQAAQAGATAADPSLTPEDRSARLRRIFGLPEEGRR